MFLRHLLFIYRFFSDETPDPRTFVEEKDIISQIPKGFQEALSAPKWKDRKDALDDFQRLVVKAVRVRDSPEMAAVCKALASRMSDANISCVVAAAACISALADALMGHFSKYTDIVMPQMLERLKERKQSVTDAIGSSLDAVFHTVCITGCRQRVVGTLTQRRQSSLTAWT